MAGRQGSAGKPRRSALSAAVTFVDVWHPADGTYHRSVTEQLALELDLPNPGPVLVVTLEDAGTVDDMSINTSNNPSASAMSLARLDQVSAQVLEFHEAFDLPREPLPTTHVSDALAELRVSLLREEVEEFADAVRDRDLIAIADALADIVYVAYGSAVTYGIDLDAVVDEVHRSNMSKLDEHGRPVLREDGKVLKSKRYLPPNIGRAIDSQLPLFATGSDTDATKHAGTTAAG